MRDGSPCGHPPVHNTGDKPVYVTPYYETRHQRNLRIFYSSQRSDYSTLTWSPGSLVVDRDASLSHSLRLDCRTLPLPYQVSSLTAGSILLEYCHVVHL